MVLLVLVALWSLVLAPPAWRNHRERRRVRAMRKLRLRLDLLASVAPPSSPPGAADDHRVSGRTGSAHRPLGAARPAGAARAPGATVARAVVLTTGPAAGAGPGPAARPVPGTAPCPAAHPTPVRSGRARLIRRRRVVLALLVASSAMTLGLVVAGVRNAAPVQLGCDLATAAYVVALVRLRRLAYERSIKVRFLSDWMSTEQPADGAEDHDLVQRYLARVSGDAAGS